MDSESRPWPVYNTDFLSAIARRQLVAAGDEPSALAIYRRVMRLRREELSAFVANHPWEPLPPAEMEHLAAATTTRRDADVKQT